jgi:pentapeptide MXKDX repeat protein
MKKLIAAAAVTALMCGSALAQNTGPQPQTDTVQKPGMNNNMDKSGMNKGTTGMSNDSMSRDGMSKDGMKKDMSKDGSPSGMKKDGMSK